MIGIRTDRARPAVRCTVLLDGCRPVSIGSDRPDALTFAVVDDACERLERVASRGLGRSPVGRWQRRALVRSLRAAEPADGDAIELLGLGRNATSEARACLVRTRATPVAAAALDGFVADGARLVSVTTPARLLARLYRRHSVPRLFVARTGADERHALVVDGVACFARTVRPGGTDTDPVGATAAAVSDSLEHLAGHHAAGRIDIAGIGLDDETLAACRALAHVGEVRHLSREGLELTLARRLAERAGRPFARRRTAHVPALAPPDADRREAFARTSRPRALRASLGAFAALSTCTALGTGASALDAFVHDRADAASVASERVRLETAIVAEREALDALHPAPLAAAAALARAEALRASAPPDADALLAEIATALGDHDALRIDSITWSMRDEGEGLERDAVFASADSLPVRVRDPLATRGAGLDVELAGRVLGATSVGAAERALDAFADSLAALPGAGRPVRLDSPLERAAAGELADDGSAWRLRLALDGRELEP